MKRLISLILLCALTLAVFAVPASAAYVTDGNGIYLAGDANEDGKVNVCDLVKANLGAGSAADLDGNGTVEGYDFALIRAIILGIDNSEWTE